MGCPIRTIDQLLNCLGDKRKDWCLVLLLDRDNLTPAGREMIQLLTQFDEDSGDYFDFYLPGYYEKSNTGIGEDSCCEHLLYEGVQLSGVRRTVIDRLGELYFSHKDFRTFYKLLERVTPNGWRHLGDCEIVLFRRGNSKPQHALRPRGRIISEDSSLARRDKLGKMELTEFCDYNLDDIVRNGNTVNQFILQLCDSLEKESSREWLTVKREVDKIYQDFIMPSNLDNLVGDSLKRLQVGQSYLSKEFGVRGYVFVSYSTKDSEYAALIRDSLERNGVRCWMAPRDIPVGTSYAFMIERAISHCGLFLLLLSESSMKSVWVEKELLLAIGRLQREDRIYVVWCSTPLPLQDGFAYSLVNVQIDNGQWLNGHKVDGIDLRDILTCYYGRGLPDPSVTRPKSWIRAMQLNPHLSHMDIFVNVCPWNQFTGEDWVAALGIDYSLKTKIRFDLLSASDSAEILKSFPDLHELFDWVRIAEDFPWGVAKRHPGLLAHFPKETARATTWVQLLRAIPDYSPIDWGRLNEILSTEDWVSLVVARPELASNCQQWDRLSASQWVYVLSRRPEIAKECDAVNGWKILNEKDWEHIIRFSPELALRKS